MMPEIRKLEVNEKISIDISKIKTAKSKKRGDPESRNPHWMMIVDHATGT